MYRSEDIEQNRFFHKGRPNLHNETLYNICSAIIRIFDLEEIGSDTFLVKLSCIETKVLNKYFRNGCPNLHNYKKKLPKVVTLTTKPKYP